MTPHRPTIGQTAGQPGGGRTGAVQHNILAAAASGVSNFIAAQGGCPDRVFHRAGVEERALGQPTVALDLRAYVAMMEVAAAETGNDNFGLLYGRQFQP